VKYNVLYAARTAGPTLIYVSFILFFIALVVFLLELHVPTAIAIVTFLGIFLVGHGLTSVIPCLTTEAPYRTPLSSSLEALYRGARTGQMPSQRLNELAELADIEQHRTRIDKRILTWLATSAKRTVIQEKAAELLFQANKNELVV
jgi:xanthosine utilization system XapX-like protein